MTEQEADKICAAFMALCQKPIEERGYLGVEGINKWMDAFIRSSYYKALKNK